VCVAFVHFETFTLTTCRLLTGSISGQIYLWTKFTDGDWRFCKSFIVTRTGEYGEIPADTVDGLAFLSDAEFISADRSHGLTVWRVDCEGEKAFDRGLPEPYVAFDLALHPNKQRVCFCADTQLCSVDVKDIDKTKGDAIVSVDTSNVMTIAASPCGKYVATGQDGVSIYSFYDLQLLVSHTVPPQLDSASSATDLRALLFPHVVLLMSQ